MCLERVYRGKEKKAILDKIPDKFYAYKNVLQVGYSKYQTSYQRHRLYAGLNKFKCNRIFSEFGDLYVGGSHLLIKKPKQGDQWFLSVSGERTVRVKVKKSWIKTAGKQWGATVITVNQAIFPKYFGRKK